MTYSYFQNAKFTGSYPTSKDMPAEEASEIAFCGRSNCGKSSVLNALTNNKKLAKTSKTPGRTQAINVFEIGLKKDLNIIALPGYGYAKVSKQMRAAWGQEIEEYLTTRKCLKALCIIMDIRHPFKEDDMNLIDWCESKSLPMILLLNKSDKLSKNKASQALISAKNKLTNLTIEHYVIATSAIDKIGIETLVEKIEILK